MVYSSTGNTHKLGGGDRYTESSSEVTTAIQAQAFNMVKARIKAAGLTPPTSDDILTTAEEFYAIALMYQKGRLMGDLPTGAGASIATYDNVNKAIKMNMDFGNGMVDDYIKSVQIDVQPNDIDGQSRSDYVFKDFKLNQSDIGEFVDIDGESLADDQRS